MNNKIELQSINNILIDPITTRINLLPEKEILYSYPNGTRWDSSNVLKECTKLTYGKGTFVAGTTTSRLMYYSDDGKSWAEGYVASSKPCKDISYNNNLWVALLDDVYISSDGKNFRTADCNSSYTYYNVFSYNGYWNITCSKGIIYFTDSGNIQYTNITTGFLFNGYFIGSDKVVVTTDTEIMYSTDGINYSYCTPLTGASGYSGAHCGNGLWVIGSKGNKGLLYSSNGINWTQSNITTGNFLSSCYGLGIWVAGSATNGLYYSLDGKVWTQSNVTSGKFDNIYNKNGIFIAISSTKGIYYSTNGMTWIQTNVQSNISDVINEKGVWVACGPSGLRYSVTWEEN